MALNSTYHIAQWHYSNKPFCVFSINAIIYLLMTYSVYMHTILGIFVNQKRKTRAQPYN